MNLDFAMVIPYWQVLLKGLGVTLIFTIISALLGCVTGFIICLLRASRFKPVRILATLYVEFFRGTPLLIQVFWVFFCLPVVFSIDLPPWLCVILALMLHMAAISSETFRGSLRSINDEQYDACVALGLPPKVKILNVILPQALLRAIPTLLSNVVSLFKESALISSVGVADLMFVGQNISNSTAHPVEFLSAVAIIYFFVAFPLTRLVGVIETRMLQRYAI